MVGGEPHEIHHQPEAGCGRIRDDSRVTHLGSPSQNAGDGDDFAIQAPYHCELESPTANKYYYYYDDTSSQARTRFGRVSHRPRTFRP